MINDCARIREGGEVLDRIELDRPCFAAMLGGPDRRALFMLTAEWRGTEGMEEVIRARTGQVLVVDAPRAGRRLAVTCSPLPTRTGRGCPPAGSLRRSSPAAGGRR
jgi:hypothetical protein